MEQNDEALARKNRKRSLSRLSAMNLAECEYLISERLKALLSQQPGELSKEQIELLPVLVKGWNDLRDGQLAQLWSGRMAAVLASNPRLADQIKNTPSLHRLMGGVARVQKAGAEDRRSQAERKKLEAARLQRERELSGLVPPLGDAPDPTKPRPGESKADALLRSLDEWKA